MPQAISEKALERLTLRAFADLGEDVRRLREDAAMSIAALARAAKLDPRFVAEIAAGVARPSIESCLRLALALGADLPLHLYPTTGPLVRDHIQAAIEELLLGVLHSRWARYAEVRVLRPSRGWIDLGLHDRQAGVFVAVEVQSELRRIEQLLRWSEEKATGLPSWDGWATLGVAPSISRLLVIRDTRRNREVANEHRRLLRSAYPADCRDALEAIVGSAAWPGPAILWAARDRSADGPLRLVARP